MARGYAWRSRWFWSLVALVLVLPFGLAASPVLGQGTTVAVLLPSASAPYFTAKHYGYLEEAKKLGVKAIVYDAGSYENLAKQINQVEDAIQRGVAGIIFTATDSKGTVPAIEKAVEKGIKVINDNGGAETRKVTHEIVKDDYHLGQQAAIGLVEAMKARGKLAILPGPPGVQIARTRYQGFIEYVQRFNGIRVVDTKWAEDTADAGNKNMSDILQRHRDLAGVYCWGGPPCFGARQALKNAGAKAGQVKWAEADLTIPQEKELRAGWITVLVTNTPVEMARQSMRLIVDLVNGKTVPSTTYNRSVIITINTINGYDMSGTREPSGWKP